jgi:starvation-inducible DNA-binding protein
LTTFPSGRVRRGEEQKETTVVAKEKAKARLVRSSDQAGDVRRRFETAIDLPPDTRTEMIELLNQELADTSDLFSQTKQAHWNLKGIHFYQLHLLFDELAERREEEADELAERAVQLGGYATGTVRMAAASSSLPELPTDIDDGADYVRALVERYGLHANQLRQGIEQATEAGDQDTADLLTEVSRQVDKDLWFLQAHLQGLIPES